MQDQGKGVFYLFPIHSFFQATMRLVERGWKRGYAADPSVEGTTGLYDPRQSGALAGAKVPL